MVIQRHRAGTVLRFLSAACNVTVRIEDRACTCAGDFMYFIVNKMSYFSVYGPGLLLSFACTDSYYTYKMIKCIQNVPKVQNIQ